MYIRPHFARFRTVALVCWILATWFVIQDNIMARYASSPMLTVSIVMLACILAAIGIAFWPLSKDSGAGVVLDAKGMLLNLGHYAGFIAWENIAHVGITKQRRSLLALGSKYQLGIALRDIQPYAQSYEERMPAAKGLLAGLLRRLALLLRPCHSTSDEMLIARIAACRTATGYDVLVPEAFLGGEAEAVAQLLDQYRNNPPRRQVVIH